MGRGTDQNTGAEIFIGTFQTRGDVHAVTNHGVVHAPRRTDIARHYVAGINADAHLETGLAGGGLARVELGQCALHADCDLDCIVSILRRREGRTEHRHEGVADELVEDAVVLEYDLDHRAEILVQH